ncbi:helix-turn-helix domain-containing protein [Streptomyces sp. NBC_00847]|uniref:helix-turn-helix domain-containing protein n=1 Tax=Streptomyces sp. NBC_00847 TaxID=2975850 RepID=UPI00225E455D|nr:helix-turn-helix domain-containing protein [Streptomyces sp. NBC_00847]MCX4886075.1 helix-turn-helix domain-containing protein [Streptomyces sp. NBC_00847]
MELKSAPILTAEAPDWMKTDEVATRMGCTRRTVRNRLQSGSIPVRWTFVERTIHVNRAQFLAWLNGGDEMADVA